MTAKKTSPSGFTLNCMANQLSAAMNAAATVSDRGIKVPIVQATRIEVKDGTAFFIATNTDQSIRKHIAADGSGLVHLNTEALASKVRALRQTAPVSIVGDEKGVTIEQGRTKWKLPALVNNGAYDFEASSGPLEGKKITIPAGQLIAAAKAVQPAFSTDADRYYLSGAFFDFTGGELVAVATDGNLLHAVQFPGTFEAMDGLLMPPEAIAAIATLYAEADSLSLVATDDAFTLDDGETLFRSKMIEGSFPAWRRVVPKTIGAAHLDCGEFIAAIERASAIREVQGSKGAGRYVPLTISLVGSELAIEASNRDGEEGHDFCAAERDDDMEFVRVVAAGKLLVALRSFGQVDRVVLEFKEQTTPPTPFILRREVSDTSDFRLIQPMVG
jgi:DNA polymerase III sliding clamp (beta) subunit (PCNA family)